ncbi:MAG: PQQ-binding-like beta-propeller repeat protein [Deltaproteobacteria bacterium]|nr:PQQ-binding-like beta-propeller repeat protein [Deltaproteobacteria bacterium]
MSRLSPRRLPAQVALFRGDTRRTGRSPWRIPRRRPHVRWRFVTGRSVVASPVVDARGDVYAASLDGNVYALTASGVLRWKHRVGASIFSTPAITPSGLVVGADDEIVRSLDLRDGHMRWRFRVGPCPHLPGMGMDSVRCQVDSSPLVARGIVYVAADALYALDVSTGRLRWRAPLPGHAFASPALASDGTLVLGTKALAIMAFDGAKDGAPRWTKRGRYNCDTAPAIAPKGILTRRRGDGQGRSPADLPSRALHRGPVAYVGCDDGHLYAIEVRTGREIWRVATRRRIASSAAIGPRGRIYFGSDDGRLRVVSPEGKLVWSFATAAAIHASPLVDVSGSVVFGSRDDHLYALDASGRLLWKVRLGGDVDASVALRRDQTLIVGCDDGGVYALR